MKGARRAQNWQSQILRTVAVVIYFFYKVRPEEICLIKQIVESYENLMVVSTVDESIPKIQVSIAPDFLADCERILADLAQRFLMIRLPDPPTVSQGNY